MFTRSARRVHTSFSEEKSIDHSNYEAAIRKSNQRQIKENVCDDLTSQDKKRRANYVSYPTDDEETVSENGVDDKVDIDKKIYKKKLVKILKENNHNELDSDDNLQKNVVRLTRQTKKKYEGNEKDTILLDKSNKKSRKNKAVDADIESVASNNNIEYGGKIIKKTKRTNNGSASQVLTEEIEQVTVVKKKNKRKKKGKLSNSSLASKKIVEEKSNSNSSKFEKSYSSIDSFHSAAGSPESKELNRFDSIDTLEGSKSKNISKEIIKSNISTDDQKTGRRLKSSIQSDTVTSKSDDMSFDKFNNASLVIDQDINVSNHAINVKATRTDNHGSVKKQSKKTQKLSIKNDTINKVETLNKSLTAVVILQNASHQLKEEEVKSDNTSATKKKHTAKLNNSVIEDSVGNLSADKANRKTYQTKTDIIDDKKYSKLNTTFDKTDEKTSTKSSLISSDGTLNVTYDKSDMSCISITSDESKAENIVNTTPVLVESSMDDSNLQNTSKKASFIKNQPATTPLKREGTFTKDGPEIMSPRAKRNSQTPIKDNFITPRKSLERTPTRRVSVGIPGSTPFPFSKGCQKEKVLLNVRRSIEKQNMQHSSLVETVTKTTRVMFCSPLDNPVPATEAKRKIVKSSLKGSNKSFVFDESAFHPTPVLPFSRKRSHTEEETHSAKRSRVVDDKTSSTRLSRSRTLSASAKLSTTPSKKPLTPSKLSRTKLPNFAVLHQRRFEKMESLDECQERKAKRAKQLLTANGVLPALEKASPRGGIVWNGEYEGRRITPPAWRGRPNHRRLNDHEAENNNNRSHELPEASTTDESNNATIIANNTSNENNNEQKDAQLPYLESNAAMQIDNNTCDENYIEQKDSQCPTCSLQKRTIVDHFTDTPSSNPTKKFGTESPEKVIRKSIRKLELKATVAAKPEAQLKKGTKPKPDAPLAFPTLDSMRKGYTRFGFRMNIGANPFSVSNEDRKDKPVANVRKTVPSHNNALVRKETAKQIIMGQKPASNKNETKRIENRTHIKGVRTNRRFDLQMKMRGVDC